jgi:hypothetical protein
VTDYTSFIAVSDRRPELLEYDIVQAEQEVFAICGHEFDAPEYTPLPLTVKLSIIKLTEFYALRNSDESATKGYSSEKIGDYSYTISSANQEASTFNIKTLLSKYILPTGRTGTQITLKVRSL